MAGLPSSAQFHGVTLDVSVIVGSVSNVYWMVSCSPWTLVLLSSEAFQSDHAHSSMRHFNAICHVV
eukprot:scaffold2471_cov155-Cylindrotheca_fusiformis.AAC.1